MNKKSVAAVGTIGTVVVVMSALLFGMQGQAGATSLNITVPSGTYRQGDTINISVLCTPTMYVKAWECKLKFNKNVLSAVQVKEGSFFSGYQTFFNAGIINNAQGTIINIYDLIVGPGNVTAAKPIITITFQAIGYGSSNISLYDVGVTNETMYIPYSVTNGSIFIYSKYDMNSDKIINIQDLTDVSLHYGETGAPGLIKEDVKKDGKVNLLDLMLVADHYGAY
jgi:hypothetical protein